MLDWPTLTSVKSIRNFFGLKGYYHKFIEKYDIVAFPLTNLLKKNSFVWNDEIAKAFKKQKLAPTIPPVLKLPDFF